MEEISEEERRQKKLMERVKLDPYFLGGLSKEEQTPEICMAAVQQDGWVLEYVKEQTPEICMAAVTQNGCALCHVKNQTLDICVEAVLENPNALHSVKLSKSEVCALATLRSGKFNYFV